MAKISRLNPIIEALKSSPQKIQKISILINGKKAKLDMIASLARKKNIPISYVPKNYLDRTDCSHQGAIAVVAEKPLSNLDKMLKNKKNPFLLLLDEVSDPQNLGAVIRSAEAGGVDGIVIPERRAASLTDAVFRVSSGAAEYLPLAKVKNLARTMDELRKKGIWLIGAEGGEQSFWYEFDFTVPLAIVMGSEGKGLRPLVRKKCDKILSLPILGKVNSLNIASAASIFIYEVVRQRKIIKLNKN